MPRFVKAFGITGFIVLCAILFWSFGDRHEYLGILVSIGLKGYSMAASLWCSPPSIGWDPEIDRAIAGAHWLVIWGRIGMLVAMLWTPMTNTYASSYGVILAIMFLYGNLASLASEPLGFGCNNLAGDALIVLHTAAVILEAGGTIAILYKSPLRTEMMSQGFGWILDGYLVLLAAMMFYPAGLKHQREMTQE